MNQAHSSEINKYCPFAGIFCHADCALYFEGECSIKSIAKSIRINENKRDSTNVSVR